MKQNLFDADISDATVVTLYMFRSLNDRLRPDHTRDLKRRTRIVSDGFRIRAGWLPEKMLVGGRSISFRTIPAW